VKISLLVLSGVLLSASSAFAFSAAPPLYTTSICEPFLNDCQTPDTGFTPVSMRLSRSIVNGTWSSSCNGITTNLPTSAIKCDGEKLNGPNGENQYPPSPCVILLSGPPGLQPEALTDDWVETVSLKGVVTITCNYNPNEQDLKH
jgi:hypothetical protein